MTETISYPQIEESLIEDYRAICEQLSDATVQAEIDIREKIAKSGVRDLRGEKKRIRSTTRLTVEQQDIARKGFKVFWERMQDFEKFYTNNIGKGALVSPYSDVFTYTRLALESYTRSMYACFRCGDIAPITELTVKNRIAYHNCEDGELGHGNRTSWLYLYATFVKNDLYKEAMGLLDQILNYYVKDNLKKAVKKAATSLGNLSEKKL